MNKSCILSIFLAIGTPLQSHALSRTTIKKASRTVVATVAACAITAIIAESLVTGKAFSTIIREAARHTQISNTALVAGFIVGIFVLSLMLHQ